ncbi:hypothetical protein [Kribbella sp. NPDC055071]
MAPPEPDPAAADAVPDHETDGADEGAAEEETEEETEPKVDAGEARRTRTGFLFTCAGLTGAVAVFQLSGALIQADKYDALAWVGAVVALVAFVVLIVGYIACAIGRVTLRTKLIGRFDFFEVSTAVVLLAIVAGVFVVPGSTTALALLLPWALTYWLHNLNPELDSPAT